MFAKKNIKPVNFALLFYLQSVKVKDVKTTILILKARKLQ